MYSNSELAEVQSFAKEIRIETLKEFAALGFGHLGGAMSMVEILSVLYHGELRHDPKKPKWEQRDRLVCSKGHSGPSLYATLGLRGFFPMDMLKTLNKNGTNLPSHCDMLKTPGIDFTTGSLGQGLSVASGAAYALKHKGYDSRVFCIVGDGELQEGQNWEAIMNVANKKIDNLVLFVDYNKMQLDGPVQAINGLASLDDKFTAFNWNVENVDGHNVTEIKQAIQNAKSCQDKPTVIICNTLKGKGVNWAENEWNHHVPVTDELAQQAISALNA
ncbi:transketolase [Vibrio parahaemolyticus]|uniref:transketolase n=1 Tax=Vibrio parahaemolyticus TaxID=670 RepID=UPI0006A6C4AB|nr:transketolase [Vibrio parahaemolyticus]EGQ7765755.1 transketolase [Vibrio parahaemolyticus]EGQ8070950.1 transketolase [Vibrio parahaemolyticus]EGR3029516.1 transketolase [Vibrio parahaemolyticus]EHH1106155.1 transketolase [Vibrio parahaemolyticus]EHH2489414.1 transketolase [Vibrio parahaemolyticus]